MPIYEYACPKCRVIFNFLSKRLLGRIAKARLPKRRKRRPSEPRAIRAFQKDVAKLEGFRAAARKQLAKNHADS